MNQQPIQQPLKDLLEQSQATPEFKQAVRALAQGAPQDRITYGPGAPAVKVLRVTSKILETFPDRPIERLQVQGSSGCSNFTGMAVVQPGDLTIDFDWDCRWQAEQLGWTDYFDEPDQIRAARELGYQCFRIFRLRTIPQPSSQSAVHRG